MKMKTLCSFEMSESLNQMTQHYMPEDMNPKVYTSWTTLKMEAAIFLETLVFIYHLTQGHIPEGLNLQCPGHFSTKTCVAFTVTATVVQHAGILQVPALCLMQCA
jgi:hypothetical protein